MMACSMTDGRTSAHLFTCKREDVESDAGLINWCFMVLLDRFCVHVLSSICEDVGFGISEARLEAFLSARSLVSQFARLHDCVTVFS